MLANEIERMACAIMDKGECYPARLQCVSRSPSIIAVEWRSNASGFDLYCLMLLTPF